MKLAALVMALACGCMATTVMAGEPLQIVTADITGPPGEPAWRSWEVGGQFAIPLPAADLATTEIGLKAGLTLTGMLNTNVGVGLDVVYHYWPVSDEFKATFNTLLRHETFNLVELGGTTWRMNALQLTGHLKLVPPADGRVRPWLKIGGGAYVIDPNTTGLVGQELFFALNVHSLWTQVAAGAYGSVGVDLVRGGPMKFGLDASYDHLWTKDGFGSDFDEFAVGGHLLFGRW